ncbi:MAG: hypothetical protein ABIB79_00285 [archaeon]
MRFETDDVLPLDQRQLRTGWNFVGITSDMYTGTLDGAGYEGEYFSWDSIKGDCSYVSIYAWNPEEQEWLSIDPSLVFKEYDFDDFLGNGMLVKVSSDCTLGTSSSGTTPPGLPGDDIGQWNNYVFEGNIKTLRYSETTTDTQCEILNTGGACQLSVAKYLDSENTEFLAGVEIHNDLSKQDFINRMETAFKGRIEKGDFIGYDYYIVTESDGETFIFWHYDNKLILVKSESLTDENNDLFEDLLDVYLPKYPSDLEWS